MKKILTFIFICCMINNNIGKAETLDEKCDKVRMATIITGIIHQQYYSKEEALNMVNEMGSARTRQIARGVLDETYNEKIYNKDNMLKNVSNFAEEKYVECMVVGGKIYTY